MHEYRIRRTNVGELDRLEQEVNGLAAEGFRVIRAGSCPGSASDAPPLEPSYIVIMKRKKKTARAAPGTA